MNAEEKTVVSRSFRIDYVTGQGVEGSFAWDGAPIQVGRSSDGVRLPDQTVSSVHATVRATANLLEIRDERSSAGIFVHDARLMLGWHPLEFGETAWLGECRVRVVAVEIGEEATILLSREPRRQSGEADEWASSVLPSPPSATPEATPVASRRSREPADEPVESTGSANKGAAEEAAGSNRPHAQNERPSAPSASRQRLEAAAPPSPMRQGVPRRWSARIRILTGVASLFALAYLWYVLLTFSPTS